MEMLRGTIDALQFSASARHDKVLRCAFLESALVHARNLLDFFLGVPSSHDDVLACHVVKGYTPPPTILDYLSSCRSDINKTLSHLTYSRVALKRSWPLQIFRMELDSAYAKFLSLLPESKRAEWEV